MENRQKHILQRGVAVAFIGLLLAVFGEDNGKETKALVIRYSITRNDWHLQEETEEEIAEWQ